MSHCTHCCVMWGNVEIWDVVAYLTQIFCLFQTFIMHTTSPHDRCTVAFRFQAQMSAIYHTPISRYRDNSQPRSEADFGCDGDTMCLVPAASERPYDHRDSKRHAAVCKRVTMTHMAKTNPCAVPSTILLSGSCI
jgi:hypothetical protein